MSQPLFAWEFLCLFFEHRKRFRDFRAPRTFEDHGPTVLLTSATGCHMTVPRTCQMSDDYKQRPEARSFLVPPEMRLVASSLIRRGRISLARCTLRERGALRLL